MPQRWRNLRALKLKYLEIAVRRRCTKYVFLKISQNLQENTCVGVTF